MAKSIFATALQSLFDETDLYSKKEWADILGINKEEIYSWVADKLFPKPAELRMFIDVLNNSANVEKRPLENFKKLYDQRVSDIVPFALGSKNLLESYFYNFKLGEYILLPILEGSLRNIRTLPFDTQEKLLFQFAEECREYRELNLFENRSFVAHSGDELQFKINCDALLDEDIETLANIISKKFKFSKVYGIPRGGVRLANALEKYLSASGPLLIVDDVLTTGNSMEKAKEKFAGEDVFGVVIFARGKCPVWVRAMFMLASWTD